MAIIVGGIGLAISSEDEHDLNTTVIPATIAGILWPISLSIMLLYFIGLLLLKVRK